ncbi:hypothetical protein QUF72_13040 [Desulfobacterales bacterium HSG2]|nr:hypothetical protein [Desulfobacterales bacterium HSG2]
MKYFKNDLIRLKKVLLIAYHNKENAEPGEPWQGSVMNQIRSIGPIYAETPWFMLFDDRFVWRFATAVCLVAMILSVYVLQTGFHSEYELASLFLGNPLEFTLTQYFGAN